VTAFLKSHLFRTLAACAVGVLFLCVVAAPVHAQPDSVRTQILAERGYPPNHSPRGALLRAIAVPGWGQWYNRQYYKIPIAYAGLAGLGYAIVSAHQAYTLNRDAAIFAQGAQLAASEQEIPDVISDYRRFEGEYTQVVRDAGGNPDNLPVSARQLRSRRDNFRSRRDLSIVGTVLFYGLTVTDAYVSAHLLTFDVDEDLAVRVRPTGRLPDPGARDRWASSSLVDGSFRPPNLLPVDATTGPGVTLRVRF